jgi:hypothetical protein
MLAEGTPYVRRHVAEVIAAGRLRVGETVSEWGAGLGRFTRPLAARGFEVHAIGLSPSQAKECREDLRPWPEATVGVGDSLDVLSRSERRFDAVPRPSSIPTARRHTRRMKGSQPANSSGRMALVMGVIVFVPVLLDLLHGGTRAAFRYLAPDSFHDNTVARNIALYGSTSDDGQLPTNGFHPLWQATLAALYFVLHHLGLSESSYLVSSVLLCAVLHWTAAGVSADQSPLLGSRVSIEWGD